jgi:nicotinamidase/pyrazinamidase
MIAQDFILWEVDTQRDFMLPGGKLYVPGAEKLLPKIEKLIEAARKGRCFLVSHGCFHAPDDPEFEIFPPHCVKGTPGSEYVEQALTDNMVRVGNHADGLPRDFLLFGVVTEYCVRLAAKGLLQRGRHVTVIEDAVETLNPAEGQRTIAELRELGAKFTTTEKALKQLENLGQ